MKKIWTDSILILLVVILVLLSTAATALTHCNDSTHGQDIACACGDNKRSDGILVPGDAAGSTRASGACAGQAASAVLGTAVIKGPEFVIQPYYMFPADQPYHPEYKRAVRQNLKDTQAFYRHLVGNRIRVKSLKVVQLPDDYLTMRCGSAPTAECGDDRRQHPNLLNSLFTAIGGLPPRRPVLIYAQGAGGFAGANLFGDFTGFAVVGDWVLEPLSGVREEAATHCGFSDGWQCAITGPGMGVPFGTAPHELGHVFGLHHPPGPFMPDDKSLMRWHGDGFATSLLPHEVLILKTSPFFLGRRAFDPRAPHLDFENPDVVQAGALITLTGSGFAPGDDVELRDASHSVTVPAEVLSETALQIEVPVDMEPGYARIRRQELLGNVVPINFVP